MWLQTTIIISGFENLEGWIRTRESWIQYFRIVRASVTVLIIFGHLEYFCHCQHYIIKNAYSIVDLVFCLCMLVLCHVGLYNSIHIYQLFNLCSLKIFCIKLLPNNCRCLFTQRHDTEAPCAVCKSNATTVLFDICNVVAPSTRWKQVTQYVLMLLLRSVQAAEVEIKMELCCTL